MSKIRYPKFITTLFICGIVIISQSFNLQQHEPHKPQNLKVLPKDISEEALHNIMKGFSKSLGVKCDHCHVPIEGSKHLDFASDDKPEKLIAREMIKMTDSINKRYIAKIGNGDLHEVRCVTCHMGNVKPIFDVDSIPGKPMPMEATPMEEHHEDH